MTATLAAPAVIRFNLSRDETCTRCAGPIARGERGGFPANAGPRFLCPGCCEVLEGQAGAPLDAAAVETGREIAEHLAAAVDAIEAREALERGEPADPAAAALVAGTRDPRHKVVRFQHGGPMGLLPAVACAAGCGHVIRPARRAGRIGGVDGTACDECCTRWERGEPLPCEANAATDTAERPRPGRASLTVHSDEPAANGAQTPPVAEPAGPATGETPIVAEPPEDGFYVACTCTKRGGAGDGYTDRGDGVFVHAACGLPSPAVARGKARTVDVVTPAEPGGPAPEVGDVAGVTKLEPAPVEPVDEPPAPGTSNTSALVKAEIEEWVAGGPTRSEEHAVATLAQQVLITVYQQAQHTTPPNPATAAAPVDEPEASDEETPLDLRGWMPDAKHWGADPKTTLADLVDAVRRGILAGDLRGRQVEIGPSEVGHPCPRWLAYRLAGTPPTGTEPTPWRQRVGTLIHADVDDHAHRDNEERGTRWLTNLRVTIGELYPGRPIRGTLDVFDVLTGTVIDVKCPGATAMKTYAPGKPEAEQYRVQLQGYGRGVMLAGFLPAWVATLRLSPARELAEYIGKPERFDAGIAERALARAGGIARMVDQLGERAPALLPMVQANCHRCQWFRRGSTDPTTGCPGAPGTRADYGSRRRASVDDLVG